MMIIKHFRVPQEYNMPSYYTHTRDRVAILIKAINSDSLP